MKSEKILIFVVLTFVCFCPQILAQLEGNPENWCRSGFFPRESENYRLARITGQIGEKIYFYGDDKKECPEGKNCQLKSYLIPNDEIFVSRTFGKWACSWFQSKKGSETVGWIALDKLEFVSTGAEIEPNEFVGRWKYFDNSIEISKSKKAGFFDVKGNALWKGLGDNVHVGELEETIKLSGNIIKIGENEPDEYECKVSIRMVGRFLVVADNMQCGGVNVSFSDVYQKQ